MNICFHSRIDPHWLQTVLVTQTRCIWQRALCIMHVHQNASELLSRKNACDSLNKLQVCPDSLKSITCKFSYMTALVDTFKSDTITRLSDFKHEKSRKRFFEGDNHLCLLETATWPGQSSWSEENYLHTKRCHYIRNCRWCDKHIMPPFHNNDYTTAPTSDLSLSDTCIVSFQSWENTTPQLLETWQRCCERAFAALLYI